MKKGMKPRGNPGAGKHIGAVKPTAHSAGSQSPRPATGSRKPPAQTKQA